MTIEEKVRQLLLESMTESQVNSALKLFKKSENGKSMNAYWKCAVDGYVPSALVALILVIKLTAQPIEDPSPVEREVYTALLFAQDLFSLLPNLNTDEIREFRAAIHRAGDLVLARAVRTRLASEAIREIRKEREHGIRG